MSAPYLIIPPLKQEEILREGNYNALLLSLLTKEQVLESEAGAADIYGATSRWLRTCIQFIES